MEQPQDGYYQNGKYVEPSTPILIVEDPPDVGEILNHKGELIRIVKAKDKPRIGFYPRDENG